MLFAFHFLLAQAADGQATGGGGGGALPAMLPLVAIVVLGYFLLVRPMRKQEKERQTLLAAIKKKLGLFRTRLMNEEMIAIPVPDADAAVWEINSHLPERIGQNQGGARRRKRKR